MGETIFIDNGATFYEPGKYVIDIKSNIGSEYQYNIIVRSGTKTQSLAPQVFENIREGYAGNDNQVTSTPETGIDSLTTLMIGQRGSADFTIGTVGAVEGIGIDSEQVEILLQLNDSSRLTDNGWKIQSDDWGKNKRQKIADTQTGAVRTGAVIVQTSSDGIDWKNVDQDRYSDGLFTTDFYNNYRGNGLINLYSPSGDDVINGLYIRVFYAYKVNNKSEKKDYRYLEKYEFYMCSSNLNAVTFHNLSTGPQIENVYGDEGEEIVAIHKRMETMNTGAGTVTGFTIDTSLNPATTYSVYKNENEISNQSGERYTETGRYEIKLRSPVGNKKTVVLYVDRSTDEEALNNYFGDSFIDGKRIYSEGEYPVFEGGKTTYNINAMPDTFLPISGTIKNITTGKTIEIISSRTAQSDVLDEAGDYLAEFSTNSNYEKDLRSGDNRIFTFHFSLIAAGNAPGPQVNKQKLYQYAQSKVSDSYPIYYGLTYQSAYKGNITLAFSSREDAAKYQNSYEMII